ncbi:hypothetical protein ACMFMF_001796 [Clarireedia jacksonii]
MRSSLAHARDRDRWTAISVDYHNHRGRRRRWQLKKCRVSVALGFKMAYDLFGTLDYHVRIFPTPADILSRGVVGRVGREAENQQFRPISADSPEKLELYQMLTRFR